VLFGSESILINNIAWMLRRLPVFGVFGAGDYGIQPVYVGDLAAMAVAVGGREENVVLDAVGPESYSFEELVRLIRDRIGSRSRIIHVSPRMALFSAAVIGRLVGDVVLTRDEIEQLAANVLVSHHPPACPTRFSEWLEEHAEEVGRSYQSEVGRHFR
jgi:uncharacterized protein YbjT (DUF2867 family)